MTLFLKEPAPAGLRSVIFLCLVFLFSGGCARKPWTDPVDDNQAHAIRSLIQEKQKTDAACSSTLDAEVVISWKTAMETKSFSGFLLLQHPSSMKLVTNNPLGQTLVALVSDGDSFSSVNTVSKRFVSGSLSSLAIRNDVPNELFTGNWGCWLRGRIEIPESAEITEVRQDSSARGIWVVLANPKSKLSGKEYLLIDPASKLVLLRMLMDVEDNPIARIEYSDWQQGTSCRQPASFHITGMSMRSEITIHMTDIITDKVLTEKDFSLKPPPGYLIELRP